MAEFSGDEAQLVDLLNNGANIDSVNEFGDTLMKYAIFSG